MAKRRPAATKRRPGPGRLSAEDAERIEERLLDAATRLFAHNGFAGTTMEAIAREAGASTKTLYARYANKAEMLGAVNSRIADRIAAERAAAAPNPVSLEPQAALAAIAARLAHIYDTEETVGLTRIAISEAHRLPTLADFFVAGFSRSVAAIGAMLAVWNEAGKVRLPGKPETIARIFIEMAAGIPRIRALIGKPLAGAELDDHVATAVRVFLDGVAIRSPKKK